MRESAMRETGIRFFGIHRAAASGQGVLPFPWKGGTP